MVGSEEPVHGHHHHRVGHEPAQVDDLGQHNVQTVHHLAPPLLDHTERATIAKQATLHMKEGVITRAMRGSQTHQDRSQHAGSSHHCLQVLSGSENLVQAEQNLIFILLNCFSKYPNSQMCQVFLTHQTYFLSLSFSRNKHQVLTC